MLSCSDPPTTTTNIGNSTEKDKDKNTIRLRMSTESSKQETPILSCH